MAFDLTSPIDIQAINNTAREIQPKITRLMMEGIRELLVNFYKFPGDIRQSVNLVTFKRGSIMQPYDPTLSHKKTLGIISKRPLSVNVGMSYLSDEAEKYRNTYLGALEDLNISNEAKLPFPNWYLETIALVGMADMTELPYLGKKGAGNDTVDITDGYLEIIKDEVDAGNIADGNGNLYTLAGSATDYTASTIGDELKKQFAKFPAITQKFGVNIHIDYAYLQMYKEWFKSEYSNITDGDVPTEYLDGTNKKAKFIWTTGMEGSKRVIMATETNLVYGVDRDNKEFGKVLVFHDGSPYIVGATNKVVIGFQIRTLDKSELVVNNLE